MRGQTWALMGALQLHLVAPPAGTDPAAKNALKRDHLLRVLRQDILPDLEACCSHFIYAPMHVLCSDSPQGLRGWYWVTDSQAAGPSLQVRLALQRLQLWQDESRQIIRLAEEEAALRKKAAELERRVVVRPHVSQYTALLAEMRRFMQAQGGLERIQTLLQALLVALCRCTA